MTQDERKKCEDCNGRSYTIRTWYYLTATQDEFYLEARVRCLECHGTGLAPYDGDRYGIDWERE